MVNIELLLAELSQLIPLYDVFIGLPSDPTETTEITLCTFPFDTLKLP